MNGSEINNNLLDIDIDKYIDWYKNECRQSNVARWLDFDIMIINKMRSHNNLHCGTFKNKDKAIEYNEKINEKFRQKVIEKNKMHQSIYCPSEWLVPTFEEWETFDRAIQQNPHITELNRLIGLSKDTIEAKKNVIEFFIRQLSKEEIKNIESINKGEIILLDFFDKSRYYALENTSYMGYCQESAFFSLIYDYSKIKALEFANGLLIDLKDNKKINSSDLGLTQKQIILLAYVFKKAQIIHFNKISQDLTIQVKFISNYFGINLTGRVQDNNIYKYWKSINNSLDPENVDTDKNRDVVNKYLKESYSLEIIRFL